MDAGAPDAAAAFLQAGAPEPRPFLGDDWAFRSAGAAGAALNGADQWIGGVRLEGRNVRWRLDEGR